MIDFFMDSRISDDMQDWIEDKLSITADQIEIKCKSLLLDKKECDLFEGSFVEKWKRKQPKDKVIDSDSLAQRTMEALILLSIVYFQSQPGDPVIFKQLVEKLMDWSEAVGLIRSLSDERFNLAETSMDVDFDPSADPSQTSTFLNISQSAFDVYLLEKFKGFKRIKEITEIVAERCGIPLESDFEEEKRLVPAPSKQPKEEKETKHVNIKY